MKRIFERARSAGEVGRAEAGLPTPPTGAARPLGRTTLAGLVACLVGLIAAAPARAESTVLVLSVRALDGDDALAAELSTALRGAAAEIDDWTVSEREVSLAQMSLAHGCESTSPGCMADIAKTLTVDRLVYGTSQATAGGVALDLHNFDAVTGHVEGSYHQVVTREALAPGAIEQTARTIALHLAGAPPTGSVLVTSNLPGGQVILDGKPMGTLDSSGQHMLEDVDAGTHVVAVESAGQQERLDVEVLPGQAATAHVELVPPAPPVAAAPPPPEPEPAEDDRRGLRIGGWVALGTAAALLVSATGVWARINSINNDQDLADYRAMFPPTTPDVCAPARMGIGGETRPGIAERVADLCDTGEALEKAQWGLVAGSIAGAIVGTTLLVVARKKKGSADVAFTPRLSRREAGLQARLRF